MKIVPIKCPTGYYKGDRHQQQNSNIKSRLQFETVNK